MLGLIYFFSPRVFPVFFLFIKLKRDENQSNLERQPNPRRWSSTTPLGSQSQSHQVKKHRNIVEGHGRPQSTVRVPTIIPKSVWGIAQALAVKVVDEHPLTSPWSFVCSFLGCWPECQGYCVSHTDLGSCKTSRCWGFEQLPCQCLLTVQACCPQETVK